MRAKIILAHVNQTKKNIVNKFFDNLYAVYGSKFSKSANKREAEKNLLLIN